MSGNTKYRNFAIITNPTVGSLYCESVERSLDLAGLSHQIFRIPDSETSKSLDVASSLYDKLGDAGFGRDSCIIGLGGGVVGDLAGFVAATYMRGVGLVQIPTTLIAQADSAIGGKTGVNVPSGKNLVGAFHQPSLVISDVSVLATLSERDFGSGLAEVVKYGIISSPDLFQLLEKDLGRILRRDADVLEGIVATCAGIKASIVGQDEVDRGKRTMLNLGHTLGHALEAASDYRYSHGEAVSMGTVYSARMSARKGLVTDGDVRRISGLLESCGLPISIKDNLDIQKILKLMMADKKVRDGKIRMVLPRGIGCEPKIEIIGSELIQETLGEMMA